MLTNSSSSIVFVHGLTGNRESTWTEPESNTLWPLALLPAEVPSARILTFGYDSNIIHTFDPTAINTLAHHASLLVKSLAGVRGKESDAVARPLIFVGHSIGGLIIEQALLDCRDSSEPAENALLESTTAIAYLGTPHTGPDLMRWERTLTYLATMLHKTDEHVQHVLSPGAKMLAKVEGDFTTMLEARKHAGKRPIDMMCFYEALGVAGVGLVSFRSGDAAVDSRSGIADVLC
jgi:pimeloyl-ACP methyl ester carboxylesterase